MSHQPIIIVEDEQIIALDLQETLRRLGYSVCEDQFGNRYYRQRGGDRAPTSTRLDGH